MDVANVVGLPTPGTGVSEACEVEDGRGTDEGLDVAVAVPVARSGVAVTGAVGVRVAVSVLVAVAETVAVAAKVGDAVTVADVIAEGGCGIPFASAQARSRAGYTLYLRISIWSSGVPGRASNPVARSKATNCHKSREAGRGGRARENHAGLVAGQASLGSVPVSSQRCWSSPAIRIPRFKSGCDRKWRKRQSASTSGSNARSAATSTTGRALT